MKRDSRLSGVLHILLHMAAERRPMTSEALAKAMRSNPVVVRRIMAGLRDQGLVHSAKGHHGGWTLGCDLADITLRDIYDGLGCPSLIALANRHDAPACLVEQTVNSALEEAVHDAEALLLERLNTITLASLDAGIRRRRRGASTDVEHVHAS